MKDLSHSPVALRFEAEPFYPKCSNEYEFGMIYNNGVPEMVLTSEAEVCEILHGIQDDALDEEFPPDAQEAAELDETDAFVETLALLALMEEREEQARTGFVHIKKRWEARRVQGLVGKKPKPAKRLIDPCTHQKTHVVVTQAVVPYSLHHHKSMQEKAMNRTHVMSHKNKGSTMNSSGMNHRVMPIQQPRKQN